MHSPEFAQLSGCLPCAPAYAWNWDGLMRSGLAPLFQGMAGTQQNPTWHGEGDVWTHTRMVCEALARLPGFRSLPLRRQRELAVAALLHDAGKISCTREEDGALVSPRHGAVGAQEVRRLLWQDFALSGDSEAQCFRETVCLLIRYHTAPLHLMDNPDPRLRARKLAANGALATDFTLRMLCLLAEADVRGRICDDAQELLETIQLGMALAEEAECLDGPYDFPSAHTRRAYLAGRNVWPEQALYDDAWGEVILLCGLPGTGKDTWIAQHHPELPVVCMDDIRRQLGVNPTDKQGTVVQAAREQARAHLRAKQPFIWNATGVTPMMREKNIRLFEEYHAAVRIVYLETGWQENLRRNSQRRCAVPESVVNQMLTKLIPPEADEARQVDWLCV